MDRFTLVPKVEEGGELSAFVIASEHVQRVLEPNLQCKYQCQHLNREASSVYIIPKEEILGGFQWSTCIIIDDFDEIVELSVDITYNGDWILDFDYVWLKFYIFFGSTKDALGFFDEF